MNEFLAYRDLLWQLIRREVLVRYRHSILGVGWALLQPLGMMLLFTFVFTRAVPQDFTQRVGAPYPLFVYLGVLPWTLFATGLGNCVSSLTAHRDMVTKIYFPQQILPLTGVASAFFDFCVAAVVLVGLVVWFHVTGAWSFTASPALLLLPLVVLLQLVLMAGLGFWLALGNLWYRDVKYLFTAVIQMGMFLTNVLYPLPRDGSLTMRVLATANPMVPIIDAYRDIVVRGVCPAGLPLATAAMMAVVFFVSGWMMYRVMEGRFAERV
ncbi:MAG: ABC transporter permease [Phycisphaerales bacterium]|nr:ABC transporter permease [Phycisphaerales bacterium]